MSQPLAPPAQAAPSPQRPAKARPSTAAPGLPQARAFEGAAATIAGAARLAFAPLAPSLLLVFTPNACEVAELGAALSAGFGASTTVLTAAAAGVFAAGGYDDTACVIVAFPRGSFRLRAGWLHALDRAPLGDWLDGLRALAPARPSRKFRQTFGLLLCDATARAEELLATACAAVFPNTLILGGSTGDTARHSLMAIGAEARTNAAIFCHIATDLAIEELVLDHFDRAAPQAQKLVVTAADPERRVISELNAAPAAAEYAALVGQAAPALTRADFAAHPLIETQGGRQFVRAIHALAPDGGLELLSAVEEGMILEIGRGHSLAACLEEGLAALPAPDFILGFDCVLRRAAVEESGEAKRVARAFARHNVAGFTTYGEQHNGLHVNQTFVGLAFRCPPLHPAPSQGAQT